MLLVVWSRRVELVLGFLVAVTGGAGGLDGWMEARAEQSSRSTAQRSGAAGWLAGFPRLHRPLRWMAPTCVAPLVCLQRLPLPRFLRPCVAQRETHTKREMGRRGARESDRVG